MHVIVQAPTNMEVPYYLTCPNYILSCFNQTPTIFIPHKCHNMNLDYVMHLSSHDHQIGKISKGLMTYATPIFLPCTLLPWLLASLEPPGQGPRYAMRCKGWLSFVYSMASITTYLHYPIHVRLVILLWRNPNISLVKPGSNKWEIEGEIPPRFLMLWTSLDPRSGSLMSYVMCCVSYLLFETGEWNEKSASTTSGQVFLQSFRALVNAEKRNGSASVVLRWEIVRATLPFQAFGCLKESDKVLNVTKTQDPFTSYLTCFCDLFSFLDPMTRT